IMADVMLDLNRCTAVAPPTRTDEQILPRIRWVPIGKSNCYLDAEKLQSNPIYKIAVDILKHTNFFRAFTALATNTAIIIQQFLGYYAAMTEPTGVTSVNWMSNGSTLLKTHSEMLFKINFQQQQGFFLPLPQGLLLSTLSMVWVIQKKSNTYLMSLLMTCFNRGGHSRQSLICALRKSLFGFERLQETHSGTSSWGVITIESYRLCGGKDVGRNFTQSSIPSRRTKSIGTTHSGKRRKESHSHCDPNAKGTKREVFRMRIPNELITDDIREADYYDASLKKVAKHQRYLTGEEVSDPDSPAPKPAKSTKPKITKQAKPTAPKAATKKPQPAPIKPKEKKRNPLTEPGFGDLEADTQRAIEESLKDTHSAHRGPLPPVVFRETDTGKYQPLPEVEGKGKEKVGAEQADWVLLNLQTLKKKSPTEQYIFQRRISAPTEPSSHDESSSLYAGLGLTESDTESDEEVPPIVKSGALDEGQDGPNPGIQDEGQAGPNPGNDTVSQPLSTPGVHARQNLEHTDAEATNDTSQPQPGQMDEKFTATAYPNIQENLKLTVDDPVIPEEPASSTGTLSSLQHLAKDFSFGDQFFNDKPL
ncbi:hypothetical protein Tco_1299067, partial [Tanacetum coccineum]